MISTSECRQWLRVVPLTNILLSQYGIMRVYEWGPEDGEKILFIHGISTSCMTVSKLAQAMVDRGHRVMIFVSPYPTPQPLCK